MRQQFLYYQLLKFSGQGTSIGDALDKAVDALCASQTHDLVEVPIAVRLNGLKQISQALLGTVPIEIQQRLLEVARAMRRGGSDGNGMELAISHLGRALEAAGVAYGIRHFSQQYQPFLQSRLYKTQGMNHLLAKHGAQAVAGVSSSIESFTLQYITHTRQLYSQVLALAAMKASALEAYRIFSQNTNKRWRRLQAKELSGTRSASMSLDTKTEACSVPFLPGRRSFSLDVRAGTDKILEGIPA